MGIECKLVDFFNLSSEDSLRFDYQYIDVVSDYAGEYYTYDKLFEIEEYYTPDISELDNFLYAEIGNVEKTGEVIPVSLSLDNRNEESERLFRKIEKKDIFLPEKGNILISKIRPYLNKNVLVGEENIYFTKAFLQIRPKINNLVLYYALRTVFFNNLNYVSRQGKGYPTLNENGLKNIRFPKKIVDKLLEKEEYLASEISNLTSKIYILKKQRTDDVDIINKVIGEELNFDWQEFKKLQSTKTKTCSLTNFANNVDFRFSYRFHDPAGLYLYKFLKSKTDKSVKDFISEPIVLGKGISPKEYDDEDGEYYYIAMSSIKNWELDLENSRKVNDKFASDNIDKSVRKGDILLARSGEGTIGKVALIENEGVLGIFADFIQRIRLKDYNVKLAYYYFRSDFFQYLVYTDKKGLGNNTNIFPSQIQEFPIIYWEKEEQLALSDKIESLINEQIKVDHKIDATRNEIIKLIENAVKNKS